MFEAVGKLLILAGGFLLLLGFIFVFWQKIPFAGKMCGDIFIQKKKFSFFFPLSTCIIISILLTCLINFIIWLLRK